jgi:alpha-1,6-mannosyltransferase
MRLLAQIAGNPPHYAVAFCAVTIARVWPFVLAAAVIEVGWIVVCAAALPLTESYDFSAAMLGQTGELWTWAIPLRRVPSSVPATWLVAGLVLVTLGYLVALWLQYRGRGRLSERWIIGLTLVFMVTLLLMPGLLSSDVLAYIAFGREAAQAGINPYLTSPWDAIAFGPQHASPYGPLWTDLSVALAWLTSQQPMLQQALAYRVLGAAAHLVNCFLIARLVANDGVETRRFAVLLYAWNPLALLELVGSAHNDGLMLTFVLLGLWLLKGGSRWWLALAAIWLGALVKWVPAVLVVCLGIVWLQSFPRWRSKLVWMAVTAAGLLVLTLVLFGPWIDLQDPPALLTSASAGGERYVNALVDLPTTYIAVRWVDPHGHDLQAAESAIRAWAAMLVRAAFALYVAIELVHLWRARADVRTSVETATRILLVALLLVFTQVLPWYFVWPLTLGVILGLGSAVGMLAVAYSVVYLPVFYALHENLLPSSYVAPVLLAYVLLPLALLCGRAVVRALAAPDRARAVDVAFRA